jgi:hypothetical protein
VRYTCPVQPGDPGGSAETDLYLYSGSQIQLHQRVDGLLRRFHDIQYPLVRTNLVLVTRVLVGMRRDQDRVALLAGGQWNRSAHLRAGTLRRIDSMILATTPAPTVRPPSRIAKRRPSSIAIGTISVTTICRLSPGITISTPSGSSHAPVTSVVRK